VGKLSSAPTTSGSTRGQAPTCWAAGIATVEELLRGAVSGAAWERDERNKGEKRRSA
jgi:hypothetical protein